MDNKIIEKIQKLLSLATSSNENEAKLASAKANELLLRYNISLADIRVEDRDYNVEEITQFSRRSIVTKFVYPLLTKYFFIKIVSTKMGKRSYKISFIAEKSNLEIAKYMDEFLQKAFKRNWEKYSKSYNLDSSYKQSYYLGFYHGICQQLEATKSKVEQEYGLVVSDKDPGLENFMQKVFKNMKNDKAQKLNLKSQEVINAGKEDGKKLVIKKGIEQESNKENKLKLG